MSHLLRAHPSSVNFLRAAHNEPLDRIRNPQSHDTLANRISDSARVCDARNGEPEPSQPPSTRIPDDSTFNTNENSGSLLWKREQWGISDIDEYLAASRLCREQAMACSLLAAGVHWPFAERENRKKNKHKPLFLAGRALNAGTKQSWRGLKTLFSKQFMPFSIRDHRGLHHINTAINKRSLKALNVGGRRMAAARIRASANDHDFILGCKKLGGKENVEQNGNEIREFSNSDAEICHSRLSLCEKTRKLQQGKLKRGGIKRKVHILLSKASSIALEVCDLLNLE